MAIQKIHLAKLLQIFDAAARQRTELLRADIRSVVKKERDDVIESGGDFHMPFWHDCKEHVAKRGGLREMTEARIAASKQRARLYPLLTEAFLKWWDERSRINEPYEILERSPKGRFAVPSLDCTVKVENLFCAVLNQTDHRLGYPYFPEAPILSAESARLGLWVLSQTLTLHPPENFRILDVLRSKSFSPADVPFQGNEERLFLEKYAQALRDWEKLREEY